MRSGNVHRSATIKDVARLASVSTTTISRFLNGKFDTMSAQTRARVQEVIHQLDYKPSQIARGLRSARSKSLGVVVADILNPYSIAVLKGLEDACSKSGYSMIVCNSNENPRKELKCIQMLEANRVDGIIINSTFHNSQQLLTIAESIPLVLLDRKIEGANIDTVTTNNTQGTLLAIQHLIDRGCKQVVMLIRDADGISPRFERIEAFQEFFSRKDNRVYHSSLITIPRYDQHRVTQILKSTLLEPLPRYPVGLILGNGVLSLMALKSLRALNVKISDDLLVVGFDDPEWASVAQPSLTVIAQPTYEVGKRAARLILSRIARKRSNHAQPRVIQLDMQLVERESTMWL